MMLTIYELLKLYISEKNVHSNNINNNKIKNDEPWIIGFDNEKNSCLFHMIKKYIRLYYQKILFDVSYLIHEINNKMKKDPYQKLLNCHKKINKNFVKITSKEISAPNEIIKTNNIFEEVEEEILPHLEEILVYYPAYVIYKILPTIIFNNPNSDKNQSSLDKNRESILVKLSNLALLSEWIKVRNFKKWFCCYNEQIMCYSQLNIQTTYTSLYDYNDNLYKGPMLLGKKNGLGEFHYKKEQMIYSGEYENDLREGEGKLASIDGTYLYIGGWKNNKMEGNGILNSSKLGKYKGQFHNDCFEGKGEFVDLNNNIYNGMFYKGEKKGKGEIKLNNGNIYIGDFNHNKYNGKGILKDAKGNILQEGEFKDGNLIKAKKLYKDERKSKDSVNFLRKDSAKELNINPLHEGEEAKYSEILPIDSIDEDENENEEKLEEEEKQINSD